jgi:Zn finger protein HypA/HybF involved in hydrogenase expression
MLSSGKCIRLDEQRSLNYYNLRPGQVIETCSNAFWLALAEGVFGDVQRNAELHNDRGIPLTCCAHCKSPLRGNEWCPDCQEPHLAVLTGSSQSSGYLHELRLNTMKKFM